MIRKYYDYNGLGGGIDPKSSIKSEITTDTEGRVFTTSEVVQAAVRVIMRIDEELIKEREKTLTLETLLKECLDANLDEDYDRDIIKRINQALANNKQA